MPLLLIPPHRETTLVASEQLQPHFEIINEHCTLPTLDDAGRQISDGHAAAIYLLSMYSPTKYVPLIHNLYPHDMYTRAIVHQRLVFESAVLMPCLVQAIRLISLGDASELPANNAESVRMAYRMLEAYLARHDWVAGDAMTIADMSIFTVTTQLSVHVPIVETTHPLLAQWCDRIELALPELVAANEEHLRVYQTQVKHSMASNRQSNQLAEVLRVRQEKQASIAAETAAMQTLLDEANLDASMQAELLGRSRELVRRMLQKRDLLQRRGELQEVFEVAEEEDDDEVSVPTEETDLIGSVIKLELDDSGTDDEVVDELRHDDGDDDDGDDASSGCTIELPEISETDTDDVVTVEEACGCNRQETLKDVDDRSEDALPLDGASVFTDMEKVLRVQRDRQEEVVVVEEVVYAGMKKSKKKKKNKNRRKNR